MSAPAFAASRALFRPQPAAFRAGLRRPTFRPLQHRQHFGRRYQSTGSSAGSSAGGGSRSSTTGEAASQEAQSWFQRMRDSPIGIKTVHFWAPVMKWCLVIAGISDFARPAEKLSLTQNAALTATGTIWTRWALIIKPRNILLAAVNAFLAGVGVIQLSRIALYQQQQKRIKDQAAATAGVIG